jgi:hypothetical protein
MQYKHHQLYQGCLNSDSGIKLLFTIVIASIGAINMVIVFGVLIKSADLPSLLQS